MDLEEQIPVSTDALILPNHSLASDTVFLTALNPLESGCFSHGQWPPPYHPLPNPDEHNSLIIYSIIYLCPPDSLGLLFILKTVSVLQGR